MNSKSKIFYDGKCHLCATEVKIYKKQDKKAAFEFVDISEEGFNAEAEGLDAKKINKRFHVKTADGKVLEGVEAFQAIWEKLPKWNALLKISQKGPVNALMKLGYRAFAEVRPFLPKRKKSLKL